MTGMSPTARSLAWARDHGLRADVVERWLPKARKRRDLFGFLDLLVLDGETCIGVQATSGSNVAARRRKMLEERGEALADWLAVPGHTAEVWGWSKRGARGKRKTWQLRRVPVGSPSSELEDLRHIERQERRLMDAFDGRVT